MPDSSFLLDYYLHLIHQNHTLKYLMNIFPLFVLFLVCGAGCQSSESKEENKGTAPVQKIADTVKHGSKLNPGEAHQITFKGVEYNVFIADLQTEEIDF